MVTMLKPARRRGLDALRPDDPRWETALRSVGFHGKRQKQDAAAMGLGSAIELRRERKAANRARTNELRRHNRRTR